MFGDLGLMTAGSPSSSCSKRSPQPQKKHEFCHEALEVLPAVGVVRGGAVLRDLDKILQIW